MGGGVEYQIHPLCISKSSNYILVPNSEKLTPARLLPTVFPGTLHASMIASCLMIIDHEAPAIRSGLIHLWCVPIFAATA
jgi:hypothetical protein